MSKTTPAPLVGIIMGSDSDWPLLQKGAETLKEFGVPFEVRVMSAHRTPDVASEYAATAEKRGLQVLISAAGGAAHLGGVLAAHTVLPVIGVPVAGGAVNGLDSLLATIQMPAGIPVATVTLGSAGPINAALVAVQILALADPELRKKFHAYKNMLRRKVAEGDAKVQAEVARMV
ncbi:MAG: 5-(carboxyamino)imidazole ribonucleotide mutase [Kiritimatiellia bacterium]